MLGDSKTDASQNSWPTTLQASLSTATSIPWNLVNRGVVGEPLSTCLGNVTARMTGVRPATHVLINSSVNSFGLDPTSDIAALVDTIHAAWPVSEVWYMRPWSAAGNGAVADYWAGVIATVQSTRPWMHLGPDERVWLPTRTSDGTHYDSAGEAECAAQWQTFLGY